MMRLVLNSMVALAVALGVWSVGQAELSYLHTPDYFELAEDPGWDGVQRYVSPETISPLGNVVARIPLKVPAIGLVALIGLMATYICLDSRRKEG